MKFIPSPTLPEVIIIEPEIFGDDRGFFTEMYHKEKFQEAGIKENISKNNRS